LPTAMATVEPMRVGLTCAVTDYATHFKAFPAASFARVFCQPGDRLLPWTHPKLANLPATVSPWVSFKDWPGDAELNAWLDKVPRPTILTYHHERDNAPNVADQTRVARSAYFSRWRHLYDVVCAHKNRPLVQVIPIQTLQWTMARSNDAKGLVKGDSDWRTWWAGVGDGYGIDSYVDSWATGYPDPAKWLAPQFEMAAGVGRGLWLGELGSVLLGRDTGAGRAAWIRDVVDLLRERNCAGAAWWCAIGKAGSKGEVRDFHLSDKASADAWRAAMDGAA
jgi:hypothetical protein